MNLKTEFEQLDIDAFERDLDPVPGVVDALARLDRPCCVASSRTPESLYRKLARVALV